MKNADAERLAIELAQEALGPDPFEYRDPDDKARRDKAMQELVELTEELGLYDDTDAAGEPRVVRHEQA